MKVTTKPFSIRNIQPKPYTRFGVKHQPKNTQGEYNANVEPGRTIQIFGVMTNRAKFNPITRRTEPDPLHFERVFRIGDTVEHGSYNLTYTGKITAIGPQSVTVARNDIGENKKRMDLYEFIDRNCDLDLEKIAKDNAIEMECI
jgi:hypothetical protein